MHCTALTKPVTDCKRSSSSSFSNILRLSFSLPSAMSLRTVAHRNMSTTRRYRYYRGKTNSYRGEKILYISQTIRYRPSLLHRQLVRMINFRNCTDVYSIYQIKYSTVFILWASGHFMAHDVLPASYLICVRRTDICDVLIVNCHVGCNGWNYRVKLSVCSITQIPLSNQLWCNSVWLVALESEYRYLMWECIIQHEII